MSTPPLFLELCQHLPSSPATAWQVTKKVTSPLPTTDNIFYAGTGMLLCRSEEKVALFDVQQRTTVAELATPPIK